MTTVPIYSKSLFNKLSDTPRIKDASWWVRLNLFFSFSELIAWDSDGIDQTLVWGKKFDGHIYITSYTWSRTL